MNSENFQRTVATISSLATAVNVAGASSPTSCFLGLTTAADTNFPFASFRNSPFESFFKLVKS